MKTFQSGSLERTIIIGLAKRMQDVFGFSKPPQLVPSSQKVSPIAALRAASGNQIEYPLVSYSLQSVNRDTERGNPTAAIMNPQRLKISEDSSVVLELIPVVMEFEVFYVTPSNESLVEFIGKWLFAAVDGTLNFEIGVIPSSIAIAVRPSGDLSVPPKDVSLDEPSSFEFTSTLTVSAFVSRNVKNSAKDVPNLTEVNVGMYVPPYVDAKNYSQMTEGERIALAMENAPKHKR